ncbi:hypothetical protein [Sinimarinibacterium flocculans]|uniref:hypothetical protein n=1 Tax=Sinimarinibacterium flocculans TaxID=985250 RepID=UPI002492A1E2|nr:hypothetical protein [Sinimarinibacterium flocculans]
MADYQVTVILSFTASVEADDAKEAEEKVLAISEEAAYKEWNGPAVAEVERLDA